MYKSGVRGSPGSTEGRFGGVKYYYNVITGEVETDDKRSAASDLLGPYDTHEQAANALKSAKENTARNDDADDAWEHKNEDPGWSDGGWKK